VGRLALRLFLGLALCSCLQACAVLDLRPPALREEGFTAERELRGRAILERAVQASGGREAWERYDSAEMHFADEWRGLLGCLFRPWPGNPTQLHMRFDLGMDRARGRFLSGAQRGDVWGQAGDRTWSQEPGQARVDSNRESVRFLFAAYHYFFELPLRMAEAPIVLHAGSRERAGRRYDLVFVTWGKLEPHVEHDQYVLWIPEDSGRIEIAEYTIRDKFRFVSGVNFFSDFRTVDGIVLPHAYWIALALDDEDFVHRVQLEDVRFHSPGPIPVDPATMR